MPSPFHRSAACALAVALLPGLVQSQTAPEADVLSVDRMAALMIRQVELEQDLARATSGRTDQEERPPLREDVVVREDPEETPPVQPPALSSQYEPMLRGGRFDSRVPSEARDLDFALLPAGDDCAELGPWFLSLGVRRDFDSFFVVDAGKLRICSQSVAGWKAGRTNGQRSHVVLRRP